ncbi:MAG: tail fiber domain-containing protein, partial [bacterium]
LAATTYGGDAKVTLDSSNGSSAFLVRDAASNELARVASDGKVGIGTTTPEAKLSVLSTTEWGGMTVKGGTTADGATIGLANSNGLGNYSLGVYGSANVGSIANNFYVYDNVASAVRMTVASTTGNVGIGTTSPAYKLDVAGSLNATAITINGTPVATSKDTYWSTAGSGAIQYSGGNVGIGKATPAYPLDVLGDINLTGAIYKNGVAWNPLTSYTETDPVFGASAAKNIVAGDLTVWNAKVGPTRSIATTAPLTGGGTLAGDLTLSLSSATTSANGYLTSADWTTFNAKVGGSGTAGYVPKFTASGTVSTSALYSAANGNVGIGTTTPAYKLDVFANVNAAYAAQILNNSSAGSGLSVAAGGNPGNGSNKLLSLKDGGSNEKFTVLDNGHVGIGTTTPAYKLHVAGGTIKGDLGSNGISLGLTGGGSNLQIYHNAGSSVYFWNTAGGDYEFYNGAGSTSTGKLIAGAFNTGSDRRLKNNIVNTHFGISDLMKIQVRDYVYKADAANTLTTGFIAQELFEIFPNAVTKPANDDKMWSVDYGKVTPLLVKAIQEQQAQIANLSAENDTLKAQNANILKRLDALEAKIK